MPKSPAGRRSAAVLAAALLLSACAGTSPYQPAPATRSLPTRDSAPPAGDAALEHRVAHLAMAMVGVPYRYGGADPKSGFDCSGLVYYTYTQSGYAVPRTSQAQFKAARKIALTNAGAGDLVFFQDQEKLSHVGIYIGDGLFVHAPASGRTVSVASLDTPYYQEHLIGVGRLLPN